MGVLNAGAWGLGLEARELCGTIRVYWTKASGSNVRKDCAGPVVVIKVSGPIFR